MARGAQGVCSKQAGSKTGNVVINMFDQSTCTLNAHYFVREYYFVREQYCTQLLRPPQEPNQTTANALMVQGGLAALFAPDSQFKRQENATSNATAANDAATKAKPGSKRKHQPSDAAASSTAKKVKNKTSKTNTNTTTQQPPQAPTGKLSRKQKKAVKTAASAATLADSDDEAPTTSAAAASTRHAPTAEEEAEKLQRTVFVGNLPADVKKKQIVRLFSSCGPVAAVRLRSVPLPLDSKMWRTNAVKAGVVDAARGSAHAYVVFQDGAAVDAALKLNMSMSCSGGVYIHCMCCVWTRSTTSSSTTHTPTPSAVSKFAPACRSCRTQVYTP